MRNDGLIPSFTFLISHFFIYIPHFSFLISHLEIFNIYLP
jgi:hypothetical protein